MKAEAKEIKGNRNGAVEFVRFLFAIILLILHYRDDAVFGNRPVAF